MIAFHPVCVPAAYLSIHINMCILYFVSYYALYEVSFLGQEEVKQTPVTRDLDPLRAMLCFCLFALPEEAG